MVYLPGGVAFEFPPELEPPHEAMLDAAMAKIPNSESMPRRCKNRRRRNTRIIVGTIAPTPRPERTIEVEAN
jgi:hypothetical protein